MSDTNAAQANAVAEPKTPAEWKQQVEDYDLTLAGSLEPAIRTAIEKLRADAVQRSFLAELVAPTVNDAPKQDFVQPAVPDVMPQSVSESLRMYDAKIINIERSLACNPLPHFIPAYTELLAEAKEKRAKVLYDFHNPAPIPIPPPPPPISLPPEVVALVTEIIRAEVPSIIAQTIAWFRANPEWMQS